MVFCIQIAHMRKMDLIENVSKKTGIHKVDVLVTLEAFFAESKKQLIEGEPVHMPNLGDLVLKKCLVKKARHVKKNTQIIVPECVVPKIVFDPGVKAEIKSRTNVYKRSQQ